MNACVNSQLIVCAVLFKRGVVKRKNLLIFLGKPHIAQACITYANRKVYFVKRLVVISMEQSH